MVWHYGPVLAVSGLILMLIVISLLIWVYDKTISKVGKGHNKTCISCRYLGQWNAPPSQMRICWNQKSKWMCRVADKKFWIRLSSCEYYKEHIRK